MKQMAKNYDKETIERICNLGFKFFLGGNDAQSDSFALNNFLYQSFKNDEDRGYAFAYCAEKIGERARPNEHYTN